MIEFLISRFWFVGMLAVGWPGLWVLLESARHLAGKLRR